MTYPVNKAIVSITTISPVDGSTPQNVSLVFRDPGNVDHVVPVTATYHNANGYSYRGWFVPTVTGTWTRTWSASNVSTSDVSSLQVV